MGGLNPWVTNTQYSLRQQELVYPGCVMFSLMYEVVELSPDSLMVFHKDESGVCRNVDS